MAENKNVDNLTIENDIREDNLFIKWNPLYDTKHKIIDEQHRELVNIINDLYLSTIDHRINKNEAFISASKRCIEYADYHFKTEEKIMDIINYSDSKNHKAMHKSFYDEVVNQIKSYQEGQPFIANKLVKYLKDWLLEHIAFRDKIFVEELMRVLKNKENK
ncbi:bacteriohemerythrin [Brachyspira catarrhinii]|uniref:Bacteriohemerythrin n=1 Tax=Brachyspira catarrhinii TaxID=2528966 RepID=A0ABY2TRB8_9SPIR|nr:bacteriohemerythrin [Brachyspira catarrhinii]TKZ35420.1 bacteriohemerythrin [Brachyspira catarrhinii]